MLVIALLLFAFAAVGGLLLTAFRLRRGATPPVGLALVHGRAAASGLLVLLGAVGQGGFSGAPAWATTLFVVAAVGGFVLFGGHLRGRLIGLPLMLAHAGIAVAGFLTLLFAWASGA